jgi:hypothetical protein
MAVSLFGLRLLAHSFGRKRDFRKGEPPRPGVLCHQVPKPGAEDAAKTGGDVQGPAKFPADKGLRPAEARCRAGPAGTELPGARFPRLVRSRDRFPTLEGEA